MDLENLGLDNKEFPGDIEPRISGASRSTACHCAGAGTLITRSWRLHRFRAVCPSAPRPRTITWPSAQADDMGARLTEPFSFCVVRSTTGVPKYRMVGVMVTWRLRLAVGTTADCSAFMLATIGRAFFGADRTMRRNPRDITPLFRRARWLVAKTSVRLPRMMAAWVSNVPRSWWSAGAVGHPGVGAADAPGAFIIVFIGLCPL